MGRFTMCRGQANITHANSRMPARYQQQSLPSSSVLPCIASGTSGPISSRCTVLAAPGRISTSASTVNAGQMSSSFCGPECNTVAKAIYMHVAGRHADPQALCSNQAVRDDMACSLTEQMNYEVLRNGSAAERPQDRSVQRQWPIQQQRCSTVCHLLVKPSRQLMCSCTHGKLCNRGKLCNNDISEQLTCWAEA